jgi:hypothetical protein
LLQIARYAVFDNIASKRIPSLGTSRLLIKVPAKRTGPSTGDAEAVIHRTPWAMASGSAQRRIAEMRAV